MWFKNTYILFFVLLSISDFTFAQELPVKKDSTTLYRNIESFSKRSKLNSLMFRMFFKPVAVISKKEVKKTIQHVSGENNPEDQHCYPRSFWLLNN